ncbi:MAG TPA: hypothetical protein VN923_04945, partial [Thermoanaerobaculia bacterium]|nr:hypothetical protein [Thermoanaerobaculia bacterium]
MSDGQHRVVEPMSEGAWPFAATPRRRELIGAAALLALLLSIAYANVVFGGASLVYSNNLNPLDERP